MAKGQHGAYLKTKTVRPNRSVPSRLELASEKVLNIKITVQQVLLHAAKYLATCSDAESFSPSSGFVRIVVGSGKSSSLSCATTH